MKFLSLLLIFAGFYTYGQNGNTIYSEDFEDPNGSYSVTTGFTVTPPGNNPSILWSANTTLSVSGNTSFHVEGSTNLTKVWFETADFTTHDSEYVYLNFNHISKIFLANISRVEISTDQGSTWTIINGNAYKGNSPLYSVNEYFNEGGYFASNNLWESGIDIFPDSTWWVNEQFNLSGLANDTSGTSPLGYANVRLRFSAEFNFNAPSGSGMYRSGWFIDDISVIEANCDLIPPVVDLDANLYTACQGFPVGPVIPTSTNAVTVKALATDIGSGIGSVQIYWDKNGTAGSSAMSLVNLQTGEYAYTFANVSINDTISWHIIATDNDCGQSTRMPSSGSYTFYELPQSQPTKCGPVPCNQSKYLVTSFPWDLDFEDSNWTSGTGFQDGVTNSHRGNIPTSSLGNWLTSPGLGSLNQLKYAWCVAPNNTANTNSGPSSNHTIGGSKFLYTEGPINNPTTKQTANLVTPCMLLSSTESYALEFYYHMYGADIGLLHVDIDTGTSNSAWIKGYYTISGVQQSSGNGPWKKAFVPLAAFSGKTVKVRFRAEHLVSGSDANIAIDDISVFVYTPTNRDLEVVEIEDPTTDRCSFGSSEMIRISFRNQGLDTLYNIPIALRVANGLIQRDTLFKPSGLIVGDTASLLFSIPQNLSPPNDYKMQIWSEVPNDVNPLNDTIENTYFNSFSIHSFPFVEGFENAIPKSSSNPTGIVNNSSFVLNAIDNSNVNGAQWTIQLGAVRHLASGPLAGANFSDKYLVFEDDAVNPSQAEFHLPCVDFTTLNNPQLSFKYHNLSATGTIEILVKAKSSLLWNVVATLVNEQTSKDETFTEKQFDLTPYAGQSIEILIRGSQTVGTNSFIALDDLSIFERSTSDFGLVSIDNPGRTTAERGSTSNIDFTIINASTSVTGHNASLGIRLVEQCNTGTPNIITGSTSNFAFFANYAENKSFSTSMVYSSALTAGVYDMTVWLDVLNDNAEFNDTIRRTIIVTPTTDIPYFNDFDACSPDFTGISGVLDWENASPNKTGISSAYSGQNCWITNATENPVTGAQEILLTPTFSGFDTIYEAELRFWHNHDFGNGYGVVQYRDQGTWIDLVNSTSSNSYNWNTTFNSVYGGQAFSGKSNQWIFSSIRLSNLNQKQGVTRFRFLFYGDSLAEGWAIDNFEIHIPSQNSAAPMSVASSGFPTLGTNNLFVNVQNTGGKPLQEVNLTVNVNGNNIVTNQYHSFSSPLFSGKSMKVPISSPANFNSGVNTIEVITSDPNSRMDNFILDDTLIMTISILPLIDTVPYCNDLESTQSFLGYSSAGGIDSVWKYGSLDDKVLINSPYSGNSAWYTSDSAYGPLQDQYLFTPYFKVQVYKCYNFSFYHWFDTEYNLDGGTVDYTTDRGVTWYTLGSILDTAWFNTPFIQSLDAVKPGWSGSSMGWEKAQKIVKFLKDGDVQFRFRFGSNSTIHKEGWAIDDVCFEEVTGACSFIGVNENKLTNNDLNLFPNPSSNQITLSYSGLNHGKAEVKVYDGMGKLVIYQDATSLSNTDLEIDISNLSVGIYTVRLYFQNKSEPATKRFQKL